MLSSEEMLQFLIGCCGAIIAEVLHWHRIARRGKWPKYGRTLAYWFITLLLMLCGGAVAAAASPSGSPALQLLIIGIAGPQLLQAAAQARTSVPGHNEEVYLGGQRKGLLEFLGS